MDRGFSVDYRVHSNDPLKDRIHEIVVYPYKDTYIVRQFQLGTDGWIHEVEVDIQIRTVPLVRDDMARFLYQNGGSILRKAR